MPSIIDTHRQRKSQVFSSGVSLGTSSIFQGGPHVQQQMLTLNELNGISLLLCLGLFFVFLFVSFLVFCLCIFVSDCMCVCVFLVVFVCLLLICFFAGRCGGPEVGYGRWEGPWRRWKR